MNMLERYNLDCITFECQSNASKPYIFIALYAKLLHDYGTESVCTFHRVDMFIISRVL
jgi:hypothetical protein